MSLYYVTIPLVGLKLAVAFFGEGGVGRQGLMGQDLFRTGFMVARTWEGGVDV